MRVVKVETISIENCASCAGDHDNVAVYRVIVADLTGPNDSTLAAFSCADRDYTVVVFDRDIHNVHNVEVPGAPSASA